MTIANHVFDLISPKRGSGGPSLDSMLAKFDKELENFDTLVQPAPESMPRTPFDNPDPNVTKSLSGWWLGNGFMKKLIGTIFTDERRKP